MTCKCCLRHQQQQKYRQQSFHISPGKHHNSNTDWLSSRLVSQNVPGDEFRINKWEREEECSIKISLTIEQVYAPWIIQANVPGSCIVPARVPSQPWPACVVLYTSWPQRLYTLKNWKLDIPTGIGRKIRLLRPVGVNALGTKMSGLVLNTLMLMV